MKKLHYIGMMLLMLFTLANCANDSASNVTPLSLPNLGAAPTGGATYNGDLVGTWIHTGHFLESYVFNNESGYINVSAGRTPGGEIVKDGYKGTFTDDTASKKITLIQTHESGGGAWVAKSVTPNGILNYTLSADKKTLTIDSTNYIKQ